MAFREDRLTCFRNHKREVGSSDGEAVAVVVLVVGVVSLTIVPLSCAEMNQNPDKSPLLDQTYLI